LFHISRYLVDASRPKEKQCFNISSTLTDLMENSPWHPIFGYGINGMLTTPKVDQKIRNLSIPSLELETESEGNVPGGPDHSICKRKRRRSLDATKVPMDINTLKFLLSLPPSKRPYAWQEIRQVESGARKDSSDSLGSDDSTPAAGQDEIDVQIPFGYAILRTFNQDIELLPPGYRKTLRTLFRGIVQQHLGDLRDQLRHFDRLNMLAVIPELSLVVAASQVGRAALITLTRLADDFSKVAGPVVMFRLDLILPLKLHEDEYRPWVPLAGMAVAPLQAPESARGKSWEGQRWRLLLHYVDQTILSYELYRNEEEQLVVL
jgi:hypothetical protein